MCDEWAKKDSRIKVIHKPNGGQADARNRGIEAATGEYINFVDSDDYISNDHIEYLLGLMRSHDADFACASYRIVYGDGELFENQPEEELYCVDNIGLCKAYMGKYYMQLSAPWCKMIRADLVKANPFPRGHLHEDEATMFKHYYGSTRAVISNRQIYAYFQNSGSVTHNRSEKNQEDTLQAFESQVEYYGQVGCGELESAAAERLILHLVSTARAGDKVSRRYIKQRKALKYVKMDIGYKYMLLYFCYDVLGIDINNLMLRLKKK